MSPDGRFAAADGKLYDTRSSVSRLPLLLYESTGKYDRPLFSPGSRFLAKERNKGLRVWEVATGRPLLDLPEAALHLAAFSQDGRLLACGNGPGFQVWDMRTGKVILDRAAPPNRNRYDAWAAPPTSPSRRMA